MSLTGVDSKKGVPRTAEWTVRRLALFVEDPEWRTKVSHPRLPSSWGWDDDLEEPDGRLAGHSTWSGVDPWSEMIAGGGFTIFDKSKGHP